MAIIFPNRSITAAGNRINIPNSVIQFVDNTTTINATVTSGNYVDILSTSITTSKANNRIMVEYMLNHRNDFGQGSWCLVYHKMSCNGSQIMSDIHIGAASPHIGYFEKTFIYEAGAVGTYTFTASCRAYQGTASLGTNNSGSTNHYLRLYEIGT